VSRKLTLEDIADLRQYERERDEFRARIIDLKRRRRVALGPVVSLVFENRETVRFQVQEMARAERMLTDEQIRTELEVYNPLVPEPGQLSATLFIELTSQAELRSWLPKLVGIERAIELRLGDAQSEGGLEVVRCTPEQAHEASLTRDTVTAAVHYVRFDLDPSQIERFATGPAVLASVHPEYTHAVALPDDVRQELLSDLRS